MFLIKKNNNTYVSREGSAHSYTTSMERVCTNQRRTV